MELIITSIEDLVKVANKLLQFAGERRIMAFSGEIGAGKTTLIQQLCAKLGVKESVTSPTFALANVYTTAEYGEIYHLDLYRLKNKQEALDIGIEEYLYEDRYCFIEWPEVISDSLPDDLVHISIELLENSRRKIVFL
jgi:tRNA threonylcarbamoyladenosine biosynthesis protein TsaE